MRAADILAINTGDAWANRIILGKLHKKHTVTVISPGRIANIDFELFDVIYITDKYTHKRSKGTPFYALALAARRDDIATYLKNGGCIAVGVQAYGGSSEANGDEYAFLPPGLVEGQPNRERIFGDDVVILEPDHPLLRPFCQERFSLESWGSSYHGALPKGSLPVLAETFKTHFPLIRAGPGPGGTGLVVVWTLDPDHHFTPSAVALVRSAIDWLTRKQAQSISAKCELQQGGNALVAVVKGGVEGTSVLFRLDGEQPREVVFDAGGRAKTTWLGVETGDREVKAELPCRVVLEVEVECRCAGSEKLSAKCRGGEEGNVFKATAKRGKPGEPVVFRLDEQMPRSETFSKRGKAFAEWFVVSSGKHLATADLSCNVRLRKRATCP